MDSDLAVQAPFPHRAYRSAYKELTSSLEKFQAVILKGPEGCGKTTLIKALQAESGGSPTPIYIDTPLASVAEFVAELNACLQSEITPDTLDQIAPSSGGCLIIFDQQAWQSAADVHHAIKQLCHDNRHSGCQFVYVRRDYLNLPLAGQNHDEPDYWISSEVELTSLQSDELSAYLAYLAARHDKTPPQLALGADLLLAEISQLRISRLESILEPLLDRDVINAETFAVETAEALPQKLEKEFPLLITAATLVSCTALALYLLFTPDPADEESEEEQQPIFADTTQDTPAASALKVALPQLSQAALPVQQATPDPTDSAGSQTATAEIQSYHSDELQRLSPVEIRQQLQPPPEEAFSLSEEESISFSVDETETETAAPSSSAADPGDLASLIEPSVSRWVEAWQSQDVDAYTQAYSRNFQGEYESPEVWREKRKWSLIRAEWIRLQRDEFFNITGDDSEVQAEFWLTYSASNGYRDKTHKQLILKQQEGNWKIVEENNIELIRLD